MLNKEVLHLQSGQGEKGIQYLCFYCVCCRNLSLKADYFNLCVPVVEKEQMHMADVQSVFIQACQPSFHSWLN